MSTNMINKNYKKDDFLILVDEKDKPWGKLEKKLVHELELSKVESDAWQEYLQLREKP